jgi:ubiquinone/menaquinone biosynthesis C-methylase UbiE
MNDKETADYYQKRAAEYEKIYYREVPERRKEIDDEANRLRKLVQGKRVLELACGTGYWTSVMSETAKSIVAVDLWPEMLAEAKKKKLGCSVEFAASDMFAFQAKAKGFDFVAVGFWFSHQPKQENDLFFELVKRPLKNGGQIWLIDNNPPAEGTRHEMVRTDEFGNSFKRRYLEDGSQHTILKNYYVESELRDIFSSHFTQMSLIYKKYYWSAVLGISIAC